MGLGNRALPGTMWSRTPISAAQKVTQTKSRCVACGSSLGSDSALFKEMDTHNNSKESRALAEARETIQSATHWSRTFRSLAMSNAGCGGACRELQHRGQHSSSRNSCLAIQRDPNSRRIIWTVLEEETWLPTSTRMYTRVRDTHVHTKVYKQK